MLHGKKLLGVLGVVWAITGCSGDHASDDAKTKADNNGGDPASAQPSGSNGDESGSGTASSGTPGTGGSAGAISDPITPCGAANIAGMGPVAGVGGSNDEPLACESRPFVDVHAEVTNGTTLAPPSTDGAVRVNVTHVTQQDSSISYELTDGDHIWTVDTAIPELDVDSIKVGDAVDFQLVASKGKIPFTSSDDQVFGIFDTAGKLLLFGAHVRGTLLPDLGFLGISLADGGEGCVTFGICSYNEHHAQLTAGESSLELSYVGQTGSLGDLRVSLGDYRTVSGTSCDDSAQATLVGAANAGD